MICKNCGSEVELTRAELARELGRATSAKKAESSRRNGRKGGRPKLNNPQQIEERREP